MTSPTSEPNGDSDFTVSERVQTLPAIGALREPPCFDAMGMSIARVDRKQEHVVKSDLFEQCCEDLTKQSATPPQLHRMKLPTICEQAASRAVEVSDLSTPVADLAGIEDRMAVLRELHTGAESRHRGPIEQTAQDCVNPVFDQLLTEFRELSESSPFSLVVEVDRCFEHLGRQAKNVSPTATGETRLRHLRDGMSAIYKNNAIPKHKRDILVKEMITRATSAAIDALKDLARLATEKAFWKSVARLKQDLQGLREQGVALQSGSSGNLVVHIRHKIQLPAVKENSEPVIFEASEASRG